jgi:hypothetical protein
LPTCKPSGVVILFWKETQVPTASLLLHAASTLTVATIEIAIKIDSARNFIMPPVEKYDSGASHTPTHHSSRYHA